MLEIRLFDGFELRLDAQPALIPSRAGQTLLAYLVLHRQTAHRREKLAGLLWPDDPEAAARKKLRQALWYVRRAIDAAETDREGYILADEIWVAFNARTDYWLDAGLFDAPVPADCPTQDLLSIASEYRGDLLPGFYEDWVVLERERLNAQFDRVMQILLDRLLAERRWTDVLLWGERWIATGHIPEPAYRALMTAHANLGDLAAMAAAFQRCRDVLTTELDVDPSPQTLELYHALRRGQPAASEAAPGPQAGRGAASLCHNLPHALTSFIGRAEEQAELRRLLDASRLVTLTGSGGAGKTRLALQVAADVLADYPDGAWLVELASLPDSTLVPQTVAAVFNVHAVENTRLMEALTHDLCGKRLLLILDNCEHLIVACAEFAGALLRACPQVVILATSREPLNLAGEITFRVPSLALPDPDRLPAFEKLVQIESIRLFVERAAATRPDFRLTPELAPTVAQICTRLDGMPLAIELAAARVRTLGAEQIAERLDDRFRLLTGGSRTALPRQQTLAATIDWSYELLSEAERILFHRLAVFAGGWSLEAAEVICADDPDLSDSISPLDLRASTIRGVDALDLLSRLVDKSLVLVEDRGGTVRYHFLETVRQYAAAKLLESGEAEDRHSLHLQYFGRLAAEVEPLVFSSTPRIAYDRAEADHDNLRAALTRSLQQGQVEEAVALACNLWWFWHMRGYMIEGVERLRTVLQVSDRASPPARTSALAAAAVLANETGDGERAEMLAQQCLEQCRAFGDQDGTAFALSALGWAVRWSGDYARAVSCHSQALAIYREIHQEALVCLSLDDLGIDALGLGDIQRAAAWCEESIAFGRKLGPIWHFGNALADGGTVAIAQGDHARARSRLAESLTIQQELQDPWTLVICLEGLACISIMQSETEGAARLWGAAEAIRETLGLRLRPVYQRTYAPYIASARKHLGENRFRQLWQEGRLQTREHALEEAYRLAYTQPETAARPDDSVQHPARLTPREVTVLRLLAQGLTDQQIADRLVLSNRTVHAHLRSIYSKLDVTTRSAATRRAIDLNIF